MNITKKKHLETAGWVIGDAAHFLGLSEQESRFLELKLALANGVRQLRERKGLTQAALAERRGRVSRGWRRWRQRTDPVVGPDDAVSTIDWSDGYRYR